jgi:hypothetical protein
MPELLAPTIADQVACVKREIALRARVYPKWVFAGKMKQAAADRELATMRAVLATVEAAHAGERDG